MFRNCKLQILDNSGALTASIIRVLNSTYEHPKIGDFVILAVKSALVNKKVKKHDVKKGVVVQMRQPILRKHWGVSLKFDKNGAILFGRGNNPIATRIKGVVSQELRHKKLVKILMMAPSVI